MRGFLFVCVAYCVTLHVAGFSLKLSCGVAHLLTSTNGTDAVFVLSGCDGKVVRTTEVVLRDSSNTAIYNLTLLVSHSAHVRIVVEGVRLLNSSVSLVNVSYPRDCSACLARPAIHARDALIDGSVVTLSGVAARGNATLLFVERSNVSRSSLLVVAVDAGEGSAAAAVIESSFFADSNVTLEASVVHMEGNGVVVMLRNTLVRDSKIAAVNCTFVVNYSCFVIGSSVSSVMAVEGCRFRVGELSLRNVSVLLEGSNASLGCRHRILSLDRTLVENSSVMLSEVDSVDVGIFGTSGSTWAANSWLVLNGFRMRSYSQAVPCAVALDFCTLDEVTVAILVGSLSVHPSGSGDGVLCAASCDVSTATLMARQLLILEEKRLGVDISSAASGRSMWSMFNSSLQRVELNLHDTNVNVSASVVALSSVEALEFYLSITSSMLIVGGDSNAVRLSQSQLVSSHILLSGSTASTFATTVIVLFCFLLHTSISVTRCNVASAASTALFFDSLNVTASSITVQDTAMTAANMTMLAYRTNLSETRVALVDSHLSAETGGFVCHMSTLSRSTSILILRSFVTARKNVLHVERAAVEETVMTLLDSNMSAIVSEALSWVRSVVFRSAIVIQGTCLAAASSAVLLQQAELIKTNVSLLHCNISVTEMFAWHTVLSNVSSCDIAIQSTRVRAATNAFVAQLSNFTRAHQLFADISLTAASTEAWYCGSTNVHGEQHHSAEQPGNSVGERFRTKSCSAGCCEPDVVE